LSLTVQVTGGTMSLYGITVARLSAPCRGGPR
jgi:hypothetical protein